MVRVEEYLGTSFHPDREYVDGRIQERNLGDSDHSRLQILMAGYLLNREKQWGITAFTDQRVQVKPSRFRVPDICVVLGGMPEERIFTHPPFLCIELLSPDDRAEEVQENLDDYLAFGVPYVWVVNPRTRRGCVHTQSSITEARDGVLRTQNPDIVVPLAELG